MFWMGDKTFETKCDHLTFLWKGMLKVSSEIKSHVIAALWLSYDLWLSSSLQEYYMIIWLSVWNSFPFFSQEVILSAVGRWDVAGMRCQRDKYLEKCYFSIVAHNLHSEEWNSICDFSVSVCGTFKNWSQPIIWNLEGAMCVWRTSPVNRYLKQGITDASAFHWYLQ